MKVLRLCAWMLAAVLALAGCGNDADKAAGELVPLADAYTGSARKVLEKYKAVKSGDDLSLADHAHSLAVIAYESGRKDVLAKYEQLKPAALAANPAWSNAAAAMADVNSEISNVKVTIRNEIKRAQAARVVDSMPSENE